MIRTLIHPVFLIACFLGLVNQVIEALGHSIPVVHSYLDDLCIIPITLTIGLASYRVVWPDYRLTKWHIWSVVATFALYFEIYLPSISATYTADFADVIMYALGAFTFDRTVNQNKKSNRIEATV